MGNNCGNCIRQGRSRLKHLESHVVSIRDCLYSVYYLNRFHIPGLMHINLYNVQFSRSEIATGIAVEAKIGLK